MKIKASQNNTDKNKMILKANTINVLQKNLQRTEMLIVAMERMKIYNQICQNKQSNLLDYKAVKSVQDPELVKIEQSCGEHAIISLVTAFETFYKEIVQELLSDYPDYFMSRRTSYSQEVDSMICDDEVMTYEDVQIKLNLRNRFSYYEFLKKYSITFLSDEERGFIEYIYLHRNNYVHNAGRLDSKSKDKLLKTPSPFPNIATSTEAKKLRTKLRKILFGSYKQIIDIVHEAS